MATNAEICVKIPAMRTVSDIISSKIQKYNFIEPSALVIDALTMLNSINLSYLIVKEGEKYKGLFSERDYSRNVILKGRSSRDTPVKDVMTVDLPIVDLTATVAHCMDTMNLHKTRYLLAYSDDVFKGVITIHDLLREAIRSNSSSGNNELAEKLISQDESEKIY